MRIFARRLREAGKGREVQSSLKRGEEPANEEATQHTLELCRLKARGVVSDVFPICIATPARIDERILVEFLWTRKLISLARMNQGRFRM